MGEALREEITEFLIEVINYETKRDKAVWVADIRIWFGIEEGVYEEELNEIYELVLQRNKLIKLIT